MRALELARHRLDQGVLLERLEHRCARGLDHRLELGWGMVALGHEKRIGQQIGRAFVDLEEEERHGPMIDRCPSC